MLVAIIPLLFLVVGLLLWFIASHPKVAEAGRLLFFCGMFVLTWRLGGESFRLG